MKKIILATLFLSIISLHALDKKTHSFFRSFLQPGDLVFDIGANYGQKTELYTAYGAHVVCVEPQPECCTQLKNKFFTNEHVTVVQKGIAERQGVLELAVCSAANTISTFSQEWQTNSRFSNNYQWDKKVLVDIITLDQLIVDFGMPHYCKVDVENFEYQVLAGLSQSIPYISIEFAMETFHNTKKCLAHLQKLGYKKFNFILEETHEFYLHEWVNKNEIIKIIEQLAQKHPLKMLLWGDLFAHYQ